MAQDTLNALELSSMRPLPRAYMAHELSLYVHYPFCVHKCPYCDFASEAEGKDAARDHLYIELLLKEWRLKLPLWAQTGRKLVSLYIGGGTPSLCEPREWGRLLDEVGPYLAPDAEISLEANPGTVDESYLRELHAVGFNRISIGVQSFNDRALKRLGRIHNSEEATAACIAARKAGFTNFNIDLMHGLPQQDAAAAVADLRAALALDCTHLSWYELTLEEGTYFGAHPPVLPEENVLLDIEQQGWALLDQAGFEHYEVSGYNLEGKYRCRHNLNYWLYGDYLGLGAAAHQKLTFMSEEKTAAALHSYAAEKGKLSSVGSARWGELWHQPELLLDLVAESKQPEQGLYIITRSANPEDFATYQQQCLQAVEPLLLTQSQTQPAQQEQECPESSMGTDDLGAGAVNTASAGNTASAANAANAGKTVEVSETSVDTDEEIPAQVGALHQVATEAVPFEFMLNRLRLQREEISALEYLCHTGLLMDSLRPQLEELQREQLITLKPDLTFAVTQRGKLMLNDAICAFL